MKKHMHGWAHGPWSSYINVFKRADIHARPWDPITEPAWTTSLCSLGPAALLLTLNPDLRLALPSGSRTLLGTPGLMIE